MIWPFARRSAVVADMRKRAQAWQDSANAWREETPDASIVRYCEEKCALFLAIANEYERGHKP